MGIDKSIIRILKNRFNMVPKTIILEVKKNQDERILTNIMADAISAPNIEAFRQRLFSYREKNATIK